MSSLLLDVGREVILPRFRQLLPGDVERKSTPTDPDDIVTVVDRQAEALLTPLLTSMVAGSTVIGEEAAHEHPELLGLLASDQPLWLLDPIDGTKNFAAGHDGFGVMLAYVAGGHTRASWIVLPARGEIFVAEAGGGARHNGAAVRIPVLDSRMPPRGTLHTRYMPPALRAMVTDAAEGQFQAEYDARSAAVEYMEVLGGRRDFIVYYRLLPWDHAAPALVITEAGGRSEHLNGRAYGPRSTDQVTIIAADGPTALRVRGWFAEGVEQVTA